MVYKTINCRIIETKEEISVLLFINLIIYILLLSDTAFTPKLLKLS